MESVCRSRLAARAIPAEPGRSLAALCEVAPGEPACRSPARVPLSGRRCQAGRTRQPPRGAACGSAAWALRLSGARGWGSGFAAKLLLGLFRTELQPRAWFWVTQD